MALQLNLSRIEYEHLVTTLEGCFEEIEELIKQVDWYTSELPDRIETCLSIIRENNNVQPS